MLAITSNDYTLLDMDNGTICGTGHCGASAHEQAACILATEERMRYQKLLNVGEVTIVVEVWSEVVVVHSRLAPV